ncbi:PREDICTED: serine protease snake-like isoform X2 [Wasmannia auropunctata]|uniref:serine protease snake-like isoform X2 n=1 Tax=Wasmannia auropunctata TaxID=64793 RepID=UPI0005EF8160|nr:PREDICTED: serine protease snake-like isoform X2 [Wasmannia auropunctata]
MDFHFGLIVIFLIIDVASVRSTDGSSKRISNQGYVRSGNTANSYFQSATNRQTQTNYFLPSSYDNDNIFFPNDDYNPSPNNYGNFFSTPKTDLKNTEFSGSLRPVTQTSYTPYRTPASNTPIPIFNTPADNDFTTSRTTTPPKLHPPLSSLKESSPLNVNPAERISQRKCEEYTEEILDTVYKYGINFTTGVTEVIDTCRGFIRHFLVNGIDVIDEGEFTHMVALGTGSTTDFSLMCGGTLISHTWVLTAAHCTYGPNGGPTVARIGFRNLTGNTGFGTTVLVKNIISHPDFNPPALYADIALVQLTDAVTFNSAIRPACLYHEYDILPKNTLVWVSGWGVTEFAGDPNNRLQKASLDLIDNASCAKRHNSSIEVPYGITSNMICAGDIRNNWSTDTCQGDSGGPLQIKHTESKCLYKVIGITSFGQGCAMIDVPGVYTRVSEYLSWIESIVWPQK